MVHSPFPVVVFRPGQLGIDAEPAVAATVPVLPDGGEARQWAIDELAKSVYQEAKPSLIDQLMSAFFDWLASVFSNLQGVNANLGVVVIAVGAAILIGLAIWLVKPRLNPAKSSDAEVFDTEKASTSGQYRSAAAAAADRGSFADAVTEQFRAIVRAAEERAVIDPQPGRTAEEVSLRLGGAFGAFSTELHAAGSTFNGVRYGNHPADRSSYERLVALDEHLLDQRPAYAGAGEVAGMR